MGAIQFKSLQIHIKTSTCTTTWTITNSRPSTASARRLWLVKDSLTSSIPTKASIQLLQFTMWPSYRATLAQMRKFSCTTRKYTSSKMSLSSWLLILSETVKPIAVQIQDTRAARTNHMQDLLYTAKMGFEQSKTCATTTFKMKKWTTTSKRSRTARLMKKPRWTFQVAWQTGSDSMSIGRTWIWQVIQVLITSTTSRLWNKGSRRRSVPAARSTEKIRSTKSTAKNLVRTWSRIRKAVDTETARPAAQTVALVLIARRNLRVRKTHQTIAVTQTDTAKRRIRAKRTVSRAKSSARLKARKSRRSSLSEHPALKVKSSLGIVSWRSWSKKASSKLCE